MVVLLSISNNLSKKDEQNLQLLSMSIGDIVHAVLLRLYYHLPGPAMPQCRFASRDAVSKGKDAAASRQEAIAVVVAIHTLRQGP